MAFDALTDDELTQIVEAHLKQAEADVVNQTLNALKAERAAATETDPARKALLDLRAAEHRSAARRSTEDAAVCKAAADDPRSLEAKAAPEG